MNKIKIHKLVLKNGKPLALDMFLWDQKARIFSSSVDRLTIVFYGMLDCTIKAGYDCTINAGDDCIINAGYGCVINAGYGCVINAGYGCVINAGYGCTINAWHGCTINAGENCVIVRKDVFEFFSPPAGKTIKTNPRGISGYLTFDGGVWRDSEGHECIVADGILSRVISKRRGIYKVVNHNSDKRTFLVERDGVYSHGDTLKQAHQDLMYKLLDRNTDDYKSYEPDTVLPLAECIKMYRTITGACESETKTFVESQNDLKDEYTIAELIEKTQNQYGGNEFKSFFAERTKR